MHSASFHAAFMLELLEFEFLNQEFICTLKVYEVLRIPGTTQISPGSSKREIHIPGFPSEFSKAFNVQEF